MKINRLSDSHSSTLLLSYLDPCLSFVKLPSMAIQSNVYRGIEGVVKKVPLEISSELGPKQVLIKITHSSLCGTDIHLIGFNPADVFTTTGANGTLIY